MHATKEDLHLKWDAKNSWALTVDIEDIDLSLLPISGMCGNFDGDGPSK